MNTSLNASQEAAVASDASQNLILAGAGSGKTRTLVSRIVHLIDSQTPPEQIVAITFTNAAADEMRHRIRDAYLSSTMAIGFCGTLHGFLLRLIQQNYAALGYPSARLAVLDEAAANDLLMRCAEDVGCRASLKAIKARSQGTELALKRFGKMMLGNGVISYDGILTEGLRLLRLGIDLPFSHILIDEVQDSSDLDFQIYDALPIPNKYWVGDPDQSIYSFRGGNVTRILDLKKTLLVTGNVFFLEENYRSDRRICQAAQRLIEHNQNRLAKELRPVSQEDGSVTATCFASQSGEFAAVSSSIEANIAAGQSIAVLLRTNRFVDEWTKYLLGVGIPVASRQRTARPVDWPIVKAALAVLNDPQNDWLCYTLIRLKDGEERANEIKLAANASGSSINDSTLHLPVSMPPKAWRAILERLGASSESLQLFYSALMTIGDGTGTDLMAELAATEDQNETVGQGVRVSTMHGAKGLEFDTVFLPCFEQEIIPAKRPIEEERRLAYVAFTRARHKLFIAWCESRKPAYGCWQPVPTHPSQFISEANLL